MLCGREGSELTLSLKCYGFVLCCSRVSGPAQAAAPSCVSSLLVPAVHAADSPFMHLCLQLIARGRAQCLQANLQRRSSLSLL